MPPGPRRQEPVQRSTTETEIVTSQQPEQATACQEKEAKQEQAQSLSVGRPLAASPGGVQLHAFGDWQGILLKNKRAWVRLGGHSGLGPPERRGTTGIAFAHLSWNSLQDKQQTPVRVLVDSEFASASFCIKVFALDSAAAAELHFSGSEVSQAISQHRQRQEYIRRAASNFRAQEGRAEEQAGRSETKASAVEDPAARPQEYLFERGDAWSSYALTFDVSRSIAQLTRVEFKLAVVHTSSPLDEPSALVPSTSCTSDRPGVNSRALAACGSTQLLPGSGSSNPSPLTKPTQGSMQASAVLAPTQQQSELASHEGQDGPLQAAVASKAVIPSAQTQPSPPPRYLHPHHRDHPDQLLANAAAATGAAQNGGLPHELLASRVAKLASPERVLIAGASTAAPELLYVPPRNGKTSPSVVSVQLYQNGRLGGKSIVVPSSTLLAEGLSNGHANGAYCVGSGQSSPAHAAPSAWEAVPSPGSTPVVESSSDASLGAGMPAGFSTQASSKLSRREEQQPAWQRPPSSPLESYYDHKLQQQPNTEGSGPGLHVSAVQTSMTGGRVAGAPSACSPSPWRQGALQGRRSTPGAGAGRGVATTGVSMTNYGTVVSSGSPPDSEPGSHEADAEGGPSTAVRPPAPVPARGGWDRLPSPTAAPSPAMSPQAPPPPPPSSPQQSQQQLQQQQQQQPTSAWVSGASGASSATSSSAYHAGSGRPRSKQQAQQQMGGTAGTRHGGSSAAVKQGGPWGSGPRGTGGGTGAAARHGMSSRGSSPALPTYRDQSDAGSGVERAGTPGCSTPPEPASTADLERFILQVTPMLSLDASQPLDQALQNLSLDDVWRFYMEPSLYGREVYTLGGLRGPSLCYFVPYLSAIQLFTPASPKDGPGTSRMYVSDTEGWPKHMHLKFEHFEHEMPFNRTPLYEHIEQLAESSRLEQQRERQKEKERLQQQQEKQQERLQQQQQDKLEGQHQDLQGPVTDAEPEAKDGIGQDGVAEASSPPTSMSSEASRSASGSGAGSSPAAASTAQASGGSSSAGQPRPATATPPATPAAPSGQLPSSFLREARIADLHPASWFSVAWYPVYRIPDAPLCARFLTFHSFAPMVISMQRAHAALVEEGLHRPVAIMPLQVVGLKWYNMQGERWLEALSDPAVGSNNQQGGNRRQQQYGDSGWQGDSGAGGRHQRRQPAPQMDAAWQSHLGELQVTAERLARGYGLRVLGQMGAEDVKLRHPDYEFFNTRS